MARQIHRGSCHCGDVRFEADIDIDQGSIKCNCTYCVKERLWTIRVPPENFRLLSPRQALSDYSNSDAIHHYFCPRCGIHTFYHANIPQAGGEFYGVQANCLDDLDLAELMKRPIRYCDGLHDNWLQTPADVSYL